MALASRKTAAKRKRSRHPTPPIQTTLERHPEYLRAIGTVAVEMTNLEVMLADLFCAVLKLDDDTAHAIYFAPQSTGPRLTIIKNAATEALKDWPNYSAKVMNCIMRAREYANKRNDIIHESWGLSETNRRRVSRRGTPLHKSPPSKLVPISAVRGLIYQIRVLVSNVIYVTDQISGNADYEPSPRKFLAQNPPARPDSTDLPHSPPAKPRRRQKSSRT